MSARQQLIEELNRQPDGVAGQLLTYLHSLPGYAVPAAAQQADSANHWQAYWSKVYGSCEGMEWAEPEEQAFETREEW